MFLSPYIRFSTLFFFVSPAPLSFFLLSLRLNSSHFSCTHHTSFSFLLLPYSLVSPYSSIPLPPIPPPCLPNPFSIHLSPYPYFRVASLYPLPYPPPFPYFPTISLYPFPFPCPFYPHPLSISDLSLYLILSLPPSITLHLYYLPLPSSLTLTLRPSSSPTSLTPSSILFLIVFSSSPPSPPSPFY